MIYVIIKYMKTDKEIETISDLVSEGTSNCCDALVILDICSICGEHCEAVVEEED